MTGRIFYSAQTPPYSVADGKVEIQGIPVIWDTSTPVKKNITVGEDYFEPSTGEISSLPGKPKYDNVTVSGIFNKQVALFVLDFFNNNPRARDGSLTATYMFGSGTNEVQFTLLRVRFLTLELPGFDKLGGAAAKVSLEFSYNGIKAIAQG